MAVSESDRTDAPLRIAVPPSPCRSAVDLIGWHDALSVEAGRYLLGVRSNSDAAVALLRELLSDRVVEGTDPAPNLSVYLAPPADEGDNQELHRLYLGHHRVLRSRDPGRIMARLGGYLDAHARVFDGDRPLVLAVALVSEGRAHLLPNQLRARIVDQERRWRAAGFRLIDLPWVEVDLQSAEVVVPPPPLVLDDAQRDAVRGAIEQGGTPDSGVAPGRYRLATWSARRTAGSPGDRLLGVASNVVNLPDVDASTVLPAIRDVLAEVPEVFAGMDLDALRTQLAEA